MKTFNLSLLQTPKAIISLMLLALGVICFPFVRDYLGPDFSIDQIWLLFIPLIVYVQDPGQRSLRYGWLAGVSLLAYLILGAHVFAYFAACCTIFLILESQLGKLNELSAVAVILITPAVTYVFDIFGFPIRLKLTQIAVGVLNLFGSEALAQGNFILIDGKEYSVDAVCMGLNMVVTGLIISLLLIVFWEKRQKRILPRMLILFTLVLTFGLVIIANLFRIVALVITGFPPDSFGHELIGLGSLGLVVVLPLWFLIEQVVSRKGQQAIQKEPKTLHHGWKFGLPVVLMMILIWVRADIQSQKKWPQDKRYEQIQLPGFQKEMLPLNIMRFTRRNVLVYLKP
ncbi:MAG: archaeosortase/exosortase family protein, partial [Bacteroidetes bacterium]|nr:archaeosortase/exosortase family protein [Bacteroidota bacterium]